MGTLFVVATPIGNLQDISARAREILASADLVLCEDTRVTAKLLSVYDIHVRTAALHQHSTDAKHQAYIRLLAEGKTLALVSDAGTPAISDPGGRFVEDVLRALGDEAKIIPIPGPSAVTAVLSVSGFPADTFTFLGFPPQKKGREAFFRSLVHIEHTVVFYESIHRIVKALASLSALLPERQMVLCRELTKLHEHIYRGTPAQVTDALLGDSIKGECVIVLAPARF
ncbi:16S rRNA (cytidine(1402)-2'-O)-methyltransferase [Candidatus Uhrbacteria bacterium]|nr:16S rRNA (cytidine(1402)-2'-O)-methyltransferase [Candidatus Uhrbacteria bacterium]